MKRMQEQGNNDALFYLESVRIKAFDDLRLNGHDININFDGRSGLISSHLPLLEPAEKERLIGYIGSRVTEDTYAKG